MKIKALEPIKHHPHYLAPGDEITIDDETGQHMVDLGWCENVETGEIGEREGGPYELEIDASKHGVKSKAKGSKK